MLRRRIYAYTSVFGGLYDAEFIHGSARLLELANTGALELIISDLVIAEAEAAPAHVRQSLELTLPAVQIVSLSSESQSLCDDYL